MSPDGWSAGGPAGTPWLPWGAFAHADDQSLQLTVDHRVPAVAGVGEVDRNLASRPDLTSQITISGGSPDRPAPGRTGTLNRVARTSVYSKNRPVDASHVGGG
jgi:hypothetical protein